MKYAPGVRINDRITHLEVYFQQGLYTISFRIIGITRRCFPDNILQFFAFQ